MVTINGNAIDAAGQTLAEYLTSANYDPKRIAVECNQKLIPKSQYAVTVLCDGDTLEIVSFVGGG